VISFLKRQERQERQERQKRQGQTRGTAMAQMNITTFIFSSLKTYLP
jgi:hypothetical protein